FYGLVRGLAARCWLRKMASFERGGADADDETQEMDTGSPFSGMGLPGNVRAGKGSCPCDGTVPLDDTLPLGDDEIAELETQLLGAAPNLDGETQLLLGGATDMDGETQMLDVPESPAADLNRGRSDNPFRTQPMEECEDTDVVGGDDEGTERTVLLCDEDGLSDDAATPCR
ncbi:hypothetical protein Taro_006133, partial [Colocasia esculenta]|nr:hypothetical protein [Colocasia esculenta]